MAVKVPTRATKDAGIKMAPAVVEKIKNHHTRKVAEPGSPSKLRVIPQLDWQDPRATIRNTQIIVSWVVVGSDPLH